MLAATPKSYGKRDTLLAPVRNNEAPKAGGRVFIYVLAEQAVVLVFHQQTSSSHSSFFSQTLASIASLVAFHQTFHSLAATALCFLLIIVVGAVSKNGRLGVVARTDPSCLGFTFPQPAIWCLIRSISAYPNNRPELRCCFSESSVFVHSISSSLRGSASATLLAWHQLISQRNCSRCAKMSRMRQTWSGRSTARLESGVSCASLFTSLPVPQSRTLALAQALPLSFYAPIPLLLFLLLLDRSSLSLSLRPPRLVALCYSRQISRSQSRRCITVRGQVNDGSIGAPRLHTVHSKHLYYSDTTIAHLAS